MSPEPIVFALSFVLVLLFSWAVLLPFFVKQEKQLERSDNSIEEKKERLISNLEDLEFDYLAKKVSEEDYLSSKKALLREAEKVLG